MFKINDLLIKIQHFIQEFIRFFFNYHLLRNMIHYERNTRKDSIMSRFLYSFFIALFTLTPSAFASASSSTTDPDAPLALSLRRFSDASTTGQHESVHFHSLDDRITSIMGSGGRFRIKTPNYPPSKTVFDELFAIANNQSLTPISVGVEFCPTANATASTPLVVIAHGTGGFSVDEHKLMQHLTQAGFHVAIPHFDESHKRHHLVSKRKPYPPQDNSTQNFNQLDYSGFAAAHALVETARALKPHVGRIGFLGISRGATMAMLPLFRDADALWQGFTPDAVILSDLMPLVQPSPESIAGGQFAKVPTLLTHGWNDTYNDRQPATKFWLRLLDAGHPAILKRYEGGHCFHSNIEAKNFPNAEVFGACTFVMRGLISDFKINHVSALQLLVPVLASDTVFLQALRENNQTTLNARIQAHTNQTDVQAEMIRLMTFKNLSATERNEFVNMLSSCATTGGFPISELLKVASIYAHGGYSLIGHDQFEPSSPAHAWLSIGNHFFGPQTKVKRGPARIDPNTASRAQWLADITEFLNQHLRN